MKSINNLIIFSISTILMSCSYAGVKQDESLTKKWNTSLGGHYLDLKDGTKIRYIKRGSGKPIVLLHTLRTQLDYFYKVIPELESHFTVYAIDLPGHGYSSINPTASYDEYFFRSKVKEAILKLGITELSIAGESIGASLALTLATEPELNIRTVYAINPYDYGEKYGGGVRRSDSGYWVGLYQYSHVNWRWVLGSVLRGGFYEGEKLNEDFLHEVYLTGDRNGYAEAMHSLWGNWKSWVTAREKYKNINAKVILIYGEQDWSNQKERDSNSKVIKNSTTKIIDKAGHFISLERPKALSEIIKNSDGN